MEATEQWMTGRYASLAVDGTPADAARGLVNLVNIQGSGEITITPAVKAVSGERRTRSDGSHG